ncbi:ABC transporter permease [Alcaligenaceae bacterium]|uniref:ABC transporter permease n=1 Tax=Pusillimonas sp. MFBS29 TaxID=2886690 RepID=UPI0015D27102|nr:ABC transporter permease [Pusillimonas sp. MFBS29]MCC2596239.1 ABC transporter permease [Pusillimonas sp. MFBS29]NYT58618.1 ABC transporter permease [Alcaligenaceae bacterium]
MLKNNWLSLTYHSLFILFISAPLLVVIAVSFTSLGYISLPTDGLSLRWFYAILDERQFIDAFLMSAWLALVSATVAIALAIPAALALANYRFPGRGALSAFFLSPLMIPHVVLGIAFLRFFNQAGFSGSFGWLSMTHVIVVFPYALRLTLASVTGLSRDTELAARSLGARPHTVFLRIVLPLILPGVAGGWMLAFIQSFDEVTMTVFVATPGTTTLPVAMYSYISQSIDPLVASLSTVLIVATMLTMFILDRIVGLDRVLVGKN